MGDVKNYMLILLALLFLTLGQVLQKLATSRLGPYQTYMALFRQLFQRKEIWAAILFLISGLVVWLAVLYQMDVSKAMPFLSLSYISVALLSWHRLNEAVSAQRWFGIILITLGLWLVSLS